MVPFLLAAGLAGCNRVPSSKLPAAATTAMAEALADTPNHEPIEPLCTRACGHWVEVQFTRPTGWEGITSAEAERAGPILERQRALNRAFCEEACVEASDRKRARCILRANTPKECEACTLAR